MLDATEELKTLFSGAVENDFAEYRRMIEFCGRRITADEGIPAIIGLDDLTDGGHAVLEGAQMDRQMRFSMAADALIFNWLYSLDQERDTHYPSIAPAMSALAEKRFFVKDAEESARGYRELLDE